MSDDPRRALLEDAARRGAAYLEGLEERAVAAAPWALARLGALDEPLPDTPTDPAVVLEILDEVGGPATVGCAGPRYFGFVTGGVLPAALGAGVLATAWDQNAARDLTSPLGARIESVVMRWVVDALGLPAGVDGGITTGATTANLAGLAAARRALLARRGWDVGADGLFGAPALRVVVGEELHSSVAKALDVLGLGRERVERVPVDGQGRMRAEALPALDEATVVCIQAGNVNTGAFDPARAICEAARAAGAWVHVDGAFGLWAAAAPGRAALCDGVDLADSWATDCHKWLNVPYDSGLALVREPARLSEALGLDAPYLGDAAPREPSNYVPELSRRARGIEAWAALKSLGRSGLSELVERCCALAARFAEGLDARGHRVLNEVVLNQVLLGFDDADRAARVVAAVQAEGTCWCGPSAWQGHPAMRISVSSWATRESDVERSIEAIDRVVRETA